MKEQHVFYYAYSLLTGCVCLFMSELADQTQLILGSLILACVLGIRLLLLMANRAAVLSMLLLAACFAAALSFGNRMLPFLAVLVTQAARRITRRAFSILLSLTSTALLIVILSPDLLTVCIALICIVPLWFIDELSRRFTAVREQLTQISGDSNILREQLNNQRKMSQSMEHAVRLEERNRLSARIHDKVGHGISGSILLLEGALLTLHTDADKAEAAIREVTVGLREAVDDIRAALREERATRLEAGLAQIAAILTRFEAKAVKTELTTAGDLSGVPPIVWHCIQENLTETLTNLLKHSSADRFQVSIALKNKLLRVHFQDNGPAVDFKPGLGFAAMEERCAACYGRCFFSAKPGGFSTVMTFTLRGGGVK